MLPVVLIALLGQQLGPCGVDGPIYCGGESFAFFEFAPLSGRGMPAACSCTTPTGAKGEALTFTRASSGTCLKGGTTTGIANGDLVTCSTDQARVMPGGDGSGGVGVLVEAARTNSALRSQEFDNAAWSKTSSGVAVPTVTANQAVAPDGTTTADRVQFPAVTGAQYSAVSQSAGAGAYAGGTFVKGNATTGTLWLDCHTGAADNCASCSYNASSWTRCSCAGAAGTPNLLIGNYPVGCGGVAMGAADVFLWGGQIEAGGATFSSSYIATAGAAATRAVENATFSVAFSDATNGSFAATAVITVLNFNGDAADHALLALGTAGPAYKQLLDFSPAAGPLFYISTGGSVGTGGSFLANTAMRTVGYWDASNRSIIVTPPGGAPTTNAHSGTTVTTLLEVGSFNAGAQFGGVLKRVCVDPSSTRCR